MDWVECKLAGDSRAASEVIGPILLIGLVLAGALMTAYIGADAVGSVRDNQDSKSSRIAMQEVDSRLSTLSQSSSATAATFEFGDNIEGSPRLVTNSGYFNVTVNRNPTCSVQVPLDSIRLENDQQTVAYEAGGTWIRSPGNGTSLLTAPLVSLRNGSLDVSLMNMTGIVETGTNQAVLNTSTSRRDTENAVDTVLQGECVRPDNMTVTVQSDFYSAWASYLVDETGLSPNGAAASGDSYVEVNDDGGNVTVFLNQSDLPRRTNDNINNVVNVTGADYMEAVNISDDGIGITKKVNNTYTVFAGPVAEQAGLGTIREVQGENVSRPPLDVVFVVDESGSMDGSASAGGGSKYEAVRNAMRNFSTFLDRDMDRIGLVGFKDSHPNRGKIYRTNNEMLTSDFAEFNSSTVEKTKHDGGTWTAGGMQDANALLDLRSNESRNKVVLLLTDGKNNNDDEWYVDGTEYDYNNQGDRATEEMARRANRTGTTVYTIGFGDQSDVDEPFLTDTADAGGGEYFFATDQDELKDVFASIARSISSTQQIGHYPVSTNLTANDTVQPPQITGDTSRIASVSEGGSQFLNVNDPTAPSRFSHSFAVSGGDMVNFSAKWYGCAEWRVTGQVQTVNGTQFPVTRCAQIDAANVTRSEGDNVTVFTEDDTATFNDFLANTSSAKWQTNLSVALDQYGNIYNETSNSLNLQSNQVLVLYDFPDGKNTDNRMLMIYSIGLSEEEAKPSGIIDIDIDNVDVES